MFGHRYFCETCFGAGIGGEDVGREGLGAVVNVVEDFVHVFVTFAHRKHTDCEFHFGYNIHPQTTWPCGSYNVGTRFGKLPPQAQRSAWR